MTDMERRRLQLYAKSIKIRDLRKRIDALEFVLGPLYGELDRLEQKALAAPSKKAPAKARTRR